MFVRAGENSSSRRKWGGERTRKQEIEMGDNLYSSLIISDRLIDCLDAILDVQDIIATPFVEARIRTRKRGLLITRVIPSKMAYLKYFEQKISLHINN